jgi:hypothetical protein
MALEGGLTISVAASDSAQSVAGVFVTPAAGSAAVGTGTTVMMMSGGNGDNDFSGGRGEKGRTFRGGGKRTRDNWYGFDRDKDFVKWWHRQGKAEYGGADIENAQQAREIYEDWVSQGRPVPK